MSEWLSEPNFAGETLAGRYRILGELGRGGMGIVYQAWDANLERLVVVKVPLARVLHEPNARKRFLLEMEQLRAVEHANVVWVLDCGQHGGIPYFVLQYLGGGNLADRIKDAPGGVLPLEEVLPWLPTIAETIDHLHIDRAIVHRDVKPGNILFDGQGRVYLSDFGLVKTSAATGADLTGTGMMPGSPAYMAPEQALSTEVTGAADQYALAVTLYEILSGRLPFDGETALEIVLEKKRGSATPLHSVVPGLPAAAGEAVMRAMSFEPRHRFYSCAAFVESFVGAIKRPMRPSGDKRRGRPARRGRRSAKYLARRRRRVFINTLVTTSVLAICLGLGIGYVKALRSGSGEKAGTAETARAAGPESPTPTGIQPLEVDPEAPLPAAAPARPLRVDPPEGPLRSGIAPRIEISVPRRGAVVSPAAIEVIGALRNPVDGGVLTIGSWQVSCRRGRIDYVLPVLEEPDGPLTIDITYVYPHEEGESVRERSRRCEVVLDGTPPVVELDPLPPRASGSVSVSGRVVDAHPGTLMVNGARCTVDDEGRFRASVGFGAGDSLVIHVAARDLAGNGTEVTRTIFRDDISLVVESPADGTVLARRAVVVEGRISGVFDDLSFAGSMAREGEPAGVLERVSVDAIGHFRFERTVPEDGAYNVRFLLSHPDGTVIEEATRKVIVDRTPPAFTDVDVRSSPRGRRVTGRVRDAALDRLTLNGEEIPVGPDGSFEAVLPRSGGKVLLLATDRAGWSTPLTPR